MCDLCCFFNDTATTEIYTLSLHDALPIWDDSPARRRRCPVPAADVVGTPAGTVAGDDGADLRGARAGRARPARPRRSEEHTSELQSRQYLVCRLLLEKNNQTKRRSSNSTA